LLNKWLYQNDKKPTWKLLFTSCAKTISTTHL